MTDTTARVWAHSQQIGTRLLILLALAQDAGEHGACSPDIDIIAQRSRIKRRQARRILQDLENAGELYIQRGGGRGHTSTYIILAGLTADQIARTLVIHCQMDPDQARQVAAEKGVSETEKGSSRTAEKGVPEAQKGVSETGKGSQMTPFPRAYIDLDLDHDDLIDDRSALHLHRQLIGEPTPAEAETIRAFHDKYSSLQIHEAYRRIADQLAKQTQITDIVAYLTRTLENMLKHGVNGHAKPQPLPARPARQQPGPRRPPPVDQSRIQRYGALGTT